MNIIWPVLQLFSLTDISLTKIHILDILACLLAIIYLIKPTKNLFRIGLWASILSIIWQYPYVANHQLLALVSYVGLLFFEKHFALFARYLLIIVYAFSSLYKLNTDFFDLTKSCALMPLPEVLRNSLIPFLTISVEMSLALLFAFLPMKRLTLIACFAFHIFIALIGVWDFSATIMILALASQQRLLLPTKISYISFGMHLFLWGIYSFIGIPLVIYYILMTLTMVVFFITAKIESIESTNKLSAYSLAVIFVLFIQSAGPMIGFSQHPSFAMFSNLETSSSYRNSKLPLFPSPYLDHDLTITKFKNEKYESNHLNSVLQSEWNLQNAPFGLPVALFSQIPQDWKFQFTHKGQTYTHPSLESEKLKREYETSWIERKLLSFRINRSGKCGF